MGRAAPARRALRARRRRPARLPAQSAGRSRRLRAGRSSSSRACSCRAITSSVTRTAASSRSSPQRLDPELIGSLTVIEPPATRVAAGDPAVDSFAAEGEALYASGATSDPEAFLRRFLAAVGSEFDPPSPLPPELAQGARALAVERGPVGGGDPTRRARRGGLPEARRLRRAPPRLRRDLRRPRARAASRAHRPARLRPRRPAPPRLQRRPRRLRRTSGVDAAAL